MATLSEYEAKRLRRMEENQRMLASLNLPALSRPARPQAPKLPAKSAAPVRRSGRVQTLRQKRHTRQEREQEAKELQEQQLALIAFERQKKNRQEMTQRRPERGARTEASRRLARITRKGEENDGGKHKQQRWKNQIRAMERMEQKREDDLRRMIGDHPPPIDLLPCVYSCQFESAFRGRGENAKMLNVELDGFHDMCLGKQILPEGKKTVMQALCSSNSVLFATLSSIQLWKNAMVLFVADGDYKTRLHEDELDGRKVVYFEWLALRGRQKILESTVQRLRQVQKGDARLRFDGSFYDDVDTTHEPLLLFLQHSKGPYIYCGRLGYLGHRNTEPLEFRWQLLDVASLDWEKVYSALASATSSSDENIVIDISD